MVLARVHARTVPRERRIEPVAGQFCSHQEGLAMLGYVGICDAGKGLQWQQLAHFLTGNMG
jgi:hypothetical protein